MLVIIAVVLLIAWILGLTLEIAGGLIHLVLLIALVMVALHFFRGKKSS